ncbi:type II toxin-antitoxin system VapC family toxin [Phormidium sp. CCY1219]|uniref:type II toxin-antitoxin system VapC family toxin n=1 Tax=Phormidium sp. CCY1219 TaxID=2886104 RepID=UPI002D1EDA14|nr:type II toxin-antitoxin system VapC family toxin [Phormidium sp. CCY1219]MEB3830777.1 type II toxin-antitoxin system VapC family toxin [Phormidium sp. CCY1219]
MTLWVLDTDCVSLFQRRHPMVTQRVSQVNPEEIAVTIVTVEEQMRGWLKAISNSSQSKQSDRLIWAYKGLRQGVEYFNSIEVLDFDEEAATRYAEWVGQKIRIGRQDLKIAAIAIANHGILVTRNRRDFERVPDLRFEDWTIAP